MNTAQAPLFNRNFILCVLNNLFIFTYYFALLTILPLYIMQELGGTIQQAGWALTLFLISSIAVRPFSGLIIERFGKKLAFRGSEVLFFLFAICYIFADSLMALLLIRFLHGIWFSILTTVTVPIANDFIPPHRKGEGMGYYVMSTNLGVVFGPLLALSLVQWQGFVALFAILTLLIAAACVLSFIIPVAKQHTPYVAKKLTWQDIIEMRAVPIGIIALLTAFAYSSIMSFIAAYAQSKHLFAYTSLFFIIFAVSMILVRPWVGKIYDRHGASAVIYPSFICFALGLVVVSMMHNVSMFWLAAVLIGIGYGSLFPCFQTLAIQSVENERMGYAVATFFTLFDIGMALGSVVMGILIAEQGYQLTYLACAACVIFTVLLYRHFYRSTTSTSA